MPIKLEDVFRRLTDHLEKARECIASADLENDGNPLMVKFEEVKKEIESMKIRLSKIKHWEEDLMKKGRALVPQINLDDIKGGNKTEEILNRLRDISKEVVSINELITAGPQSSSGEGDKDRVPHKQPLTHGVEGKNFASKTMSTFKTYFDCLESWQVMQCYLCLSIFPENSILKKRPLIYWWIGEGFLDGMNGRTAEEYGEEIFEYLVSEGFLIPKSKNGSPNVNCFMVHPLARQMLISAAETHRFLRFDDERTKPIDDYGRAFLFSGRIRTETINEETRSVFNVNEQYLECKSDWLSKMDKVEVLQLGRWQNEVKHHIEVLTEDWMFDQNNKEENEVSLNGLGTQTSLRYLSLRGVSRMTILPASIGKLTRLEILDLRDCQVLGKLLFDISSLRKLTHLDLSECYLLESMPKGIEKLSALQVLKGFLIGIRKDHCRLRDLARLKHLRKLSIRIRNEASQDDFADLKDFKALQILAISWSGTNGFTDSFTFPPNLKKLDLWLAPIATTPKWLRPDQFKTLEKLYIRGGQLSSLDHQANWSGLKIVILKYLKKLKIDEKDLRQMFPEVEYLEKVQCHKDDQDVYIINP